MHGPQHAPIWAFDFASCALVCGRLQTRLVSPGAVLLKFAWHQFGVIFPQLLRKNSLAWPLSEWALRRTLGSPLRHIPPAESVLHPPSAPRWSMLSKHSSASASRTFKSSSVGNHLGTSSSIIVCGLIAYYHHHADVSSIKDQVFRNFLIINQPCWNPNLPVLPNAGAAR